MRKVYPILVFDDYATPGRLSGFLPGGLNTQWIGKGCITYGAPLILRTTPPPAGRGNNWAQTLFAPQKDGTFKTQIMSGNRTNKATSSDLEGQGDIPTAWTTTARFLGVDRSKVNSGTWDLAPHLASPYPMPSSGKPLAKVRDGAKSPHQQVRELARICRPDDFIHPYFVIGASSMSSHQRLIVIKGHRTSIKAHARANRWDQIYTIEDTIVINN